MQNQQDSDSPSDSMGLGIAKKLNFSTPQKQSASKSSQAFLLDSACKSGVSQG